LAAPGLEEAADARHALQTVPEGSRESASICAEHRCTMANQCALYSFNQVFLAHNASKEERVEALQQNLSAREKKFQV
jgi:hypothetical protein